MSRARMCDALLVLGATVMVVLACLPPPARGGHVLASCTFRNLTGHECPSCGMTRSAVALARGDVLLAFHQHPAGPFVIPGLVGAALAAVWFAVRRRPPLWGRRGFAHLLTALAVLSLVGGAIRLVCGGS